MISGLKGPGEKTLKSELVQFRFLQFVILLYWLPLEEWSGIKRGLDYLKQIKRRIHSRLRWHSDNNSSNINLKQIERICSTLSFFSFFLQIHKVWSLNRGKCKTDHCWRKQSRRLKQNKWSSKVSPGEEKLADQNSRRHKKTRQPLTVRGIVLWILFGYKMQICCCPFSAV